MLPTIPSPTEQLPPRGAYVDLERQTLQPTQTTTGRVFSLMNFGRPRSQSYPAQPPPTIALNAPMQQLAPEEPAQRTTGRLRNMLSFGLLRPQNSSAQQASVLPSGAMPPQIVEPAPSGSGAIPPSPDDIDPNYLLARNRYNDQVVDFLDAIDPEVATVTNLSDMQNSLFVPNLGSYLDRARPFRMSRPPAQSRPPSPQPPPETPESERGQVERTDSEGTEHDSQSVVHAGEYLVLPVDGVDWSKLSEDELRELDDYVRHLLHSKRERAKRIWRGFKQYVRTPLGAFIVIYASLLTFWGAAWVLFLIGWLSAGSRQAYFIEICDQVLTALFCFVGIGLSPFRAVDTYHMIYIAMYHRKALRLRRERRLPPLADENDLPADEETKRRENVLSPKEQAILEHHEARFTKSHTFYRPHETSTHHAFPLDLLIVVVCILDCHSLFQIALGSATWSISYHHSYKRILTAVILSLSISCNITGGIVILIGNRRTRKNDVLERRLREALSEEAIRRKEKQKHKRIMHETVEQKEARMKAEQGPGVLDRVKEKLDEDGTTSPGGLISAVRGTAEHSESALEPPKSSPPTSLRNTQSAKGSLDRGHDQP